MGKKDSEQEAPDYEKFKTVEAVDEEIQRIKDVIIHKVKHLGRVKEEKRETNASFNESIKELEAAIDHQVGCLDGFKEHRRRVEAGKLRKAA